MNVSEAMNAAITDDMEHIAYSLFWLVSKKICDLNQGLDTVDFSKVDHEQVGELIKSNTLQMKTPIFVYSMPVQVGTFLIVLAASEADARGLYLRDYKRLPCRVDLIPHGLDMGFHSKKRGYWTIKEFKDESYSFPTVVMEFGGKKKDAGQVEYEYYQKHNKKLRELS